MPRLPYRPDLITTRFRMRAFLRALAGMAAFGLIGATALHAQSAQERDRSPHSDAILVSNVASVQPGQIGRAHV